MSDKIVEIMAKGGKLAAGAGAHLHKTQMLEFYRLMMMARELAAAKSALHRDGKIGFNLSTSGCEAISIGAACALASEDWVFPSWQFSDVAIARGTKLETILDNMLGNERDASLGRQGPGSMGFLDEKVMPISAPVGTQIAQAVGVAQAAKITGNNDVAICLFGDGAYDSPDFHSGLNFAGVMDAPVVFLTTGTTDVGDAYGIESFHVDGDDVLAIYTVVAAAVARARSGKGPAIIHAHQDSSICGIDRFATWLKEAGVIDIKLREAIAAEARHEVRVALEESTALGFPGEETLFDDVLKSQSEGLARDAEAQVRFGGEYGGSEDPDADFVVG
ncbi:MAG: pyruvate dehydrogenase E1 component alpha subunit [Planctomycetota bacterium]|jgi:pyruvate dehydrogenase E1 component alpha subunit